MSVQPDQVGAALVTRGDVDLAPILEPLAVLEQVVVWDNSGGRDLSVYGRYEAIAQLGTGVVLTVDDDTILPANTLAALLGAYEPGIVVCNVPAEFRHRYTDSGLVGFGAVFDADLPGRAFDRFWRGTGDVEEGWFNRTCDLVFTMLAAMRMVDLPYVELPYAHAETRMWQQPDHFEERHRMRELCRRIRDGVAA